MSDTSSRIRVKFLNRTPPEIWAKMYFPEGKPSWGRCDYVFDWEAKDYDWLVVYEDLPPLESERRAMREEVLTCPKSNTILLTSEPPTIKVYGRGLTSQYGYVLTSQPEWALPHRNRIFRPQAMHRHYGNDLSGGKKGVNPGQGPNDPPPEKQHIQFDQMLAEPPLEKSRVISTVCSIKHQKHTLHNQRFQFTQNLKELIPEMEIYGHGVRPMADKAESLDAYRYHLAIENYIGENHITEKLTDVFLGAALPFYCGCPNATDYFPEDSFIPLNIEDVSGSAEIIQRAIRDNEYEKRLPAILEARQLSLYRFNMFGIISEEIEKRHQPYDKKKAGGSICSRWLYLRKHPFRALQFAWERRRLGSL